MNLKIDVSLPVITIEEQLMSRATGGKCALVWWDANGDLNSWMPNHLTYMEKLYIIDSLRRRLDWEARGCTNDG